MTYYYSPIRSRNLYDPENKKPYKLSRSKIDLFLECPCCFYLDRRLGVGRPPGFPFTLNSAVDALLKQEFDVHRANHSPHPLIERYGIDAQPVFHEDLEKWRQSFVGVQYLHEPTNLIITGAIDDLWQNSKEEYLVVDYKATATNGRITELNKKHHGGYKRQMEIYQWLLRKNGLNVSDTGYFVYCNGQKDREAFDGRLDFDVTLIAYTGRDDWVEQAITDAHTCLCSEHIPDPSVSCEYCAYRSAVESVLPDKK
jgi:hypothetical protein